MVPDFLCGAGRDQSPATARHISRVEDRIVMNNDDPIRSSVDIQLDCLRAELYRPVERRNGVLGQNVMRPAVRDRERAGVTGAAGAGGALDQVYLRGFGWNRAERINRGERGQSALTAGPQLRLPIEPG